MTRWLWGKNNVWENTCWYINFHSNLFSVTGDPLYYNIVSEKTYHPSSKISILFKEDLGCAISNTVYLIPARSCSTPFKIYLNNKEAYVTQTLQRETFLFMQYLSWKANVLGFSMTFQKTNGMFSCCHTFFHLCFFESHGKYLVVRNSGNKWS